MLKFYSLLFSICFALSLSAQRNIFDGFDNNDNGWPESLTDENTVYVKDGRYTVESKSEGFFRNTFKITDGFKDHFRIEISAERDSGVAVDKGVGIVWGRADHDSTYLAFLVYGDGSFIFENRVKGKLNVVSPNSFNYAYSGDDLNSIRVERNMTTNQYDFSINEQMVLSVPYVAPLSDEAGIHLDIAGSYFLDYFWFVENANSTSDHVPAPLSMNDACGQAALHYSSAYGFSYCVPFGWRVDEYKETHQTVWPCGFPYVVNTDYTRLAIEDSFSIAARNDFKIYSDSLDVQRKEGTTFSKVKTTQDGVEAYAATYRYVSVDGNATTTYRYYIYHRQSGGFMLVETIVPIWEEDLSLDFDGAAYTIATTIQWK